MESIVTKYFATILAGDEYHKAGESYEIDDVEQVQIDGLRLKIEVNNISFYHLYPCYISKHTYALSPIEITTIQGGGRDSKIGCDMSDFDDAFIDIL